MITLAQKLQAMSDAFAALFAATTAGDEKLEPGDFVFDLTLNVGYANVGGSPALLKCRGSVSASPTPTPTPIPAP